MKFKRIRMLVRLLTCALILIAVGVQRNGSIFGHEVDTPDQEVTDIESPIKTENGAIVVNTTTIAGSVKGYGGAVPLEITIKDGKIAGIETLKNSETGEFFNRVESDLIPQWIGTPINEVASKEVDAISGATLSSNAVNASVKAGVAYATENIKTKESGNATNFTFSWKYLVVIIVVLCAGIIPLFVKNHYYRIVQLAVNIIVLGFWSGTFLSYELFINYLSNGANLWSSLAIILMLVIAFVYPYFGKQTHYCTWVCPFGSLQELCGKSLKYKIKISPKVVNRLSTFQEWVWYALIFVMMAGIWSDWYDYELFKAFIFKSASIGVLLAAGIMILLSFVVQRPYCRFICPTGCLFQITQNPDK